MDTNVLGKVKWNMNWCGAVLVWGDIALKLLSVEEEHLAVLASILMIPSQESTRRRQQNRCLNTFMINMYYSCQRLGGAGLSTEESKRKGKVL